MKKLIWLILLLPILLTGTKQKEQWHYELPFRAFDLNDSIPTINQFGQIRNGIIVDAIVEACNADPSGVKLTPVELDYIRSLVGGMYVIGTWQKCNAVYGIVGTNAFKQKFNWKDPRDLDVAFRLVFFGDVNHSALGADPNGTTGYANTFINPAVTLSAQTTLHMSMYFNENSTLGNEYDMGASNSQTGQLGITALTVRRSSNTGFYTSTGFSANATNRTNISNTDSRGYYIGNFLTTNQVWKNGQNIGQAPTAITTTNKPNQDINLFCIGTRDVSGNVIQQLYSNKRVALVTIGAGLTDKQAIQQSQIVTYSQTILGRQ
jgi:hypothetical protein